MLTIDNLFQDEERRREYGGKEYGERKKGRKELNLTMTVKKFEDLDVWKESMRLVIDLYKSLKKCNEFGLKDQIQRSAVSIPSNISEGYDRSSNKEYIQFLHIAKGSCAELRTQLYIAKEIGILKKIKVDKYIQTTQKLSAMLYNLIKVRKEKF